MRVLAVALAALALASCGPKTNNLVRAIPGEMRVADGGYILVDGVPANGAVFLPVDRTTVLNATLSAAEPKAAIGLGFGSALRRYSFRWLPDGTQVLYRDDAGGVPSTPLAIAKGAPPGLEKHRLSVEIHPYGATISMRAFADDVFALEAIDKLPDLLTGEQLVAAFTGDDFGRLYSLRVRTLP